MSADGLAVSSLVMKRWWSRWRGALVALAVTGATACVGVIGGNDEGQTSGALCDGSSQEIGPTYLRRLTNAEYRATAAMLLGADLPDVSAAFPPDSLASGYTNNAEAISISDLHIERYEQAAWELVDTIFGDSERREAFVGCEATQADCAEAFVARFGRLAFRRTLSDEEQAGLLALISAGDPDDGWNALGLVVKAVLQSPSFLYRVETGDEPSDGGLRSLRPNELATRLAFLLLARAPDAELLDAAERGELDDPAGLVAWADVLFDRQEAAEARLAFAEQWLQLGALDHVQPDSHRYPGFDEPMRESMREETQRFVASVMGSPDRQLLDLIDADWTFVDQTLAELYGLPNETGGFEETSLEGSPRAGLLTQASILAVTARNEPAAIIRRGKYVRDVLLCDPPPPPPPNVPTLEGGEGDFAEQLGLHLADPVCKTCHERLDPIGLGFSRFDAIGAYHETNAEGETISEEGRVVGLEPEAFEGVRDLAGKLRDSEQVHACMVTQLHRHASGRREAAADACLLGGLTSAFAEGGYGFRALLRAYVSSPAFRYRRDPE